MNYTQVSLPAVVAKKEPEQVNYIEKDIRTCDAVTKPQVFN